MSGLLAGKVWQSNLDGILKPLAACLADIANDDGTSIYPSVAYMAWLLGRDERSVQRQLKTLREQRVLAVVKFGRGGRNKPTEYRMIEANLPQREKWRNPDMVSGLSESLNGDKETSKPRHVAQERVTPVSPDPSVPVSRIRENGSRAPVKQAKPVREARFAIPPDSCLELFPTDDAWLKINAPHVPSVTVATQKWYRKQITEGFKPKSITQWRASWENYMITYSENEARRNGNNGNGSQPKSDLLDRQSEIAAKMGAVYKP
jgi:hypothetical protein